MRWSLRDAKPGSEWRQRNGARHVWRDVDCVMYYPGGYFRGYNALGDPRDYDIVAPWSDDGGRGE